jgi:hypothetical protein
MMRVIVQNVSSLLYTLNPTQGFWQWNRGDWKQIATSDPTSIVTSGTFTFADYSTDGLWQWNGYDWRQISTLDPVKMVAGKAGEVYVYFDGQGLFQWSNNTWTKLRDADFVVNNMVASEYGLFVHFDGQGIYRWDGVTLKKINLREPVSMIATSDAFYAELTGLSGLRQWKDGTWRWIKAGSPNQMVSAGVVLYAYYDGNGIWRWDGTSWTKISGPARVPSEMTTSGAGADLYINRLTGGVASGIYRWNGTWKKIRNTPALDIDASGSILYANFGGVGGILKWEYYSQQAEGSWSPLSNSSPATTIAAGF